MKKLSIIIPAFNEARTIQSLVERVVEVSFPIEFEIILVDDHSGDATYEIMKKAAMDNPAGKLKIYRNERNRGKGYSILRGMEYAAGDVIVVQDADFEYDPSELPKLVEPILRGDADVVYGSRFMGNRFPEGMAVANYLANRLLTWFTNFLFGSRLTDMETCYKLIRKDLIPKLRLKAERFDFEPEITAKCIKNGVKILELPIRYVGRTASEGKKIKARDFFIAIQVLLKNRFSSQ